MENQNTHEPRRTRRRYSREEKQRHTEAQRTSGLNAAAYCREHGLSYGNFLTWQRQVATPQAFQAVELVAGNPRGEVVAEIRFGRDRVLLVQSGCSEKLAIGLAKSLL
jgi:transposase-like protein